MVEYSKIILQKVSFSRELFAHELAKALRWIQPSERAVFYSWCMITFSHLYGDLIRDIFSNVK